MKRLCAYTGASIDGAMTSRRRIIAAWIGTGIVAAVLIIGTLAIAVHAPYAFIDEVINNKPATQWAFFGLLALICEFVAFIYFLFWSVKTIVNLPDKPDSST